jgi:hypothetical protein
MTDQIFVKENVASRTEEISKLLGEINEMKQNRSSFILEKVVVLEHDMPGRQRLQILDELESLFYATMDMLDERDLALNQVDKMAAEIDILPALTEFDKTEKRIRIRQSQRLAIHLETEINSRTKEIDFLLGLLKQLPAYTREQFEKEEPEYWRRRWSRQSVLSMRGMATGAGEGNLDVLRRSFMHVGDESPLRLPDEIIQALLTINFAPINPPGENTLPPTRVQQAPKIAGRHRH